MTGPIGAGDAARLARRVGGAITIAACVALLWRTAHDGAALRDVEWTLRPIPLLLSLSLETAVLAAGVALWRRLLVGAVGAAPRYRTLLATWWRTSVSRYLPGRVWPFVAAEIARGDAPRGAMAATLLAHAALALVASLLVGATLAREVVAAGALDAPAAALARVGPAVWLAAAGVVVLAIGVVASDGRWRSAATAGATVGTAMRAVLSPALLLLHAASWVVHGVALFLFARAVLPAPPPLDALPAVVGAGALASGAGTLLGVAPAGLGVREAVLGALLATQLPVPAALLLAIAARPWATAAELLVGALVVALRGRPAARVAAAGAR